MNEKVKDWWWRGCDCDPLICSVHSEFWIITTKIKTLFSDHDIIGNVNFTLIYFISIATIDFFEICHIKIILQLSVDTVLFTIEIVLLRFIIIRFLLNNSFRSLEFDMIFADNWMLTQTNLERNATLIFRSIHCIEKINEMIIMICTTHTHVLWTKFKLSLKNMTVIQY